jgi:WD40 repeat protein
MSVGSIEFSPDGRAVAAALYYKFGLTSQPSGGEVKLWDLPSAKRRVVTPKQGRAPFAIAFTSNGKQLAIVDGKSSLSVWDRRQVRLLAIPDVFRGFVTEVGRGAAQDELIVASCAPMQAVMINFERDRLRGPIQQYRGDQHAVRASCGGSFVAFVESPDKLTVWDMLSPGEEPALTINDGFIECFQVVPDDGRIILGKRNGAVECHDVASGDRVTLLTIEGDIPTALGLSRDGQFLAVGTRGSRVHVWNLDRKQTEHVIKVGYNGIWVVAVAPQAKLIAWGERGGIVTVWNPSSNSRVTLK